MQPQSDDSRSDDPNNNNGMITALSPLEQQAPHTNEPDNESTTTKIDAHAFTADMFKPTASHLFLKRKRASHAYIPESAERVKRLYPELQADQDFLHQMLDIWTNKLHQLQTDQLILERMAGIPESQLQGVSPLGGSFNYTQQQRTRALANGKKTRQPCLRRRREQLQKHHYNHREPVNGNDEAGDVGIHDGEQQERKEDDDADIGGGDAAKDGGSDEDENDRHIWDARAMLSDDSDNENGADEDEEAARRALTFMLAEFGDELE
ncbi:hypothetical protein BDB00DRAFT_521671 [Zychaea mexicana]|uniref:uncharacterized protein n=1 Tax=Zychaea mexicana TaxID=64656 RepID=UPI0022FE2F8C|nr:uncharacterized protein BDB00DRAFT_521671 [Zychaea mexicana]KAI9490965.1 hypothetical protein BDB00DRAFT_521671 [Zychaea mexicana]